MKPYTECPRFKRCNVNNCPLHLNYPLLPIDEDDKERKCTMEKNVRFRVGSKYPESLKWQGLTNREFIGRTKYDALTESQKDELRQRARLLRFASKTPIRSSCQEQKSEVRQLPSG